jgi:F0F1-type ATP synthase assembly protein I
MPHDKSDSLFSNAMSIAGVGTEMAAPIGLGIFLDFYFGWKPWATISGALLGLVLGITHLALFSRTVYDQNPPGKDKPS